MRLERRRHLERVWGYGEASAANALASLEQPSAASAAVPEREYSSRR